MFCQNSWKKIRVVVGKFESNLILKSKIQVDRLKVKCQSWALGRNFETIRLQMFLVLNYMGPSCKIFLSFLCVGKRFYNVMISVILKVNTKVKWCPLPENIVVFCFIIMPITHFRSRVILVNSVICLKCV